MRTLLPLALILALPSCATMPDTTRVTAAVQRAADAWDRFRATAVMWLPLLPADRQVQVNTALLIGDRAVATARLAVTAAEAAQALAQAQGAMVQITAALPVPAV